MFAHKVGWIGGGRVARIMLGGWQRAGVLPAEIIVSEPNAESREKLKADFPAVKFTADIREEVGDADLIIVAVHPPQLIETLKPLSGRLRPDAILLSLAPKVKFARLVEALGGFDRVARTIPNAASLINAGFNPVALGPGLTAADRDKLLTALRPLGECPIVPEDHLEAYAVLTAMGPTYLWFQFQQLRQLGESFGLPGAAVEAGLEAMAVGAARTFFGSGLTPEAVMDLVPVKPLLEEEATIRQAYQTRLGGFYQKLKT